MAPTIVLITGANRGIGRGILELYLAKPNHTVIAANRDPTHRTSAELLALPAAEGTTLKVVKLDATSPTDAGEAAQTLKAKEGIEHIDILIANAGIGFAWPKLEDVSVDDIRTHFETNVYGFVRVYQAFLAFLMAAKDPKNAIPFPNAAYAPSKVVQHWYTKTVAVQEPWLTAFPIDPGFVQSDLGNVAAGLLGLEKASITIEESARGVLSVIDASTNATHSGKLWQWSGEEEPW
ncbi:NAD(P)-binding protein [Aspergillus crustosus]